MPRSNYKHWRNSPSQGGTFFVTTTCLDFAELFRRDEMKDRLQSRLFSDCAHYGAILHAFVIMAHHLHMLLQVPEGKTVSWFVQRFKTNSANDLLPCSARRNERRCRLNPA
ncbi:MAG: transposase [Armatimonadetes bacterium]|nr:transposase [Armatimonadota bacterium]